MIDIHSHILPATDDGSRSLEESLTMARQEAMGGTTVVFATPHIYTVADFAKSPGFIESVADLQEEFNKESVGITLATGAELYPMMEIMDALEEGWPITLANMKKHVLIDLPLGQWPLIMDKLTYELLGAGITPIFAHPERTAPVQENVEILIPFLERGVLCQINSGSLSNKYGPQAQKRGYEILSRRWAQFLASDMHRPTTKGSSLKHAKDKLLDLPFSYLDEITQKNPACVLAGTSIPSISYDVLDKPAKRGILAGLFRKRA